MLSRTFSHSFFARASSIEHIEQIMYVLWNKKRNVKEIKSHHQNYTAYKFPSVYLKTDDYVDHTCSCWYIVCVHKIHVDCIYLWIAMHTPNHVVYVSSASCCVCACWGPFAIVYDYKTPHFCTWQTSSVPISLLRQTTLVAIEFSHHALLYTTQSLAHSFANVCRICGTVWMLSFSVIIEMYSRRHRLFAPRRSCFFRTDFVISYSFHLIW